MSRPTADRVRELFSYDPLTGVLSRRRQVRHYRPGPVGAPSGHGYLKVHVDGRQHYLHQLAWLYVNGEWPAGVVDHINRDKTDNRIENLRVCTRAENAQNKAPDPNKNGYPGVKKSASGPSYFSQISVNNKPRYLGSFPTPEAAHAAYLNAKRELHKFAGVSP